MFIPPPASTCQAPSRGRNPGPQNSTVSIIADRIQPSLRWGRPGVPQDWPDSTEMSQFSRQERQDLLGPSHERPGGWPERFGPVSPRKGPILADLCVLSDLGVKNPGRMRNLFLRRDSF